jgi:glycosyltransferase involved in cell wall biosynthesis
MFRPKFRLYILVFLYLLVTASLVQLIAPRSLNFRCSSSGIFLSNTPRYRRRLEVLFVLPPWLPVPPSGYGGIENVAAALIPSLERRGVKLTVATVNGSSVEASQVLGLTDPLFDIIMHEFLEVDRSVEPYISKLMEVIHDGNFDLIHDFSGVPAVINALVAPHLAPGARYPPIIHTVHGPLEENAKLYEHLSRYPHVTFTGLSRSQFRNASSHVQARTRIIPNGIDPDDFASSDGTGRLLVMGRVCAAKGQDRLVAHAHDSALLLDIAGTVTAVGDAQSIRAEAARSDSLLRPHADFQNYASFSDKIDGERIRFLGNVGGEFKRQLLSRASALAMPIRWAEPFGMVAIEALASGTPVVAMALGAMPEIVVHGRTGYLAETWEEFTEYLKPEMLSQISREECRRHAKDNFSIDKIVGKYYDLYQEAVRKVY